MTESKKKPSTKAREAAADDGYVTLELCGIELRIGVGDNLPAGVIDAYIESDGGLIGNWKATRAFVGEQQWANLKAAGMTKGDVKELDVKLTELLGN